MGLICWRLLSRSACWSRCTVTQNSLFSFSSSYWMSTAATQNSSVSKTPNSSSCPWLMLPPAFNNDASSIDYKFYSLAENRVLIRPQTKRLTDLMPNPIHDLRVVGSSHGWLALFNPHTLDLFLYDPISLRHVMLPPIHGLPNYPKGERRSVHKVMLSCSPDDDQDNCRAVMIYNCIRSLAFCCPGRSDEWTPIGHTHVEDDFTGERIGSGYQDVVYSSKTNLFFGLTKSCELETWDLSRPWAWGSAVLLRMINTCEYLKYNYKSGKSLGKSLGVDISPKNLISHRVKYLVVAEDDVLLVTQFVMEQVAPDGSYVRGDRSDFYPHKTIDFYILAFDQEKGHLKFLEEESLGDLALFIGSPSESVSLSAARFPALKPNSIYFTDSIEERFDPSSTKVFGGHDIGILNYENKTMSPCYYPCDVRSLKRVAPMPMWFFPRL